MNREQAIEAVATAMPHWAGLIREWLADSEAQDLRELAVQAVWEVDHFLAYGSETVGFGNALDDLRRAKTDADVLDTLAWWDQAYEAWYLTSHSDGQGHGGALDPDDEPCPLAIQNRIYDLIFSGSADLALELAERWSEWRLTPDEQEEYGLADP